MNFQSLCLCVDEKKLDGRTKKKGIAKSLDGFLNKKNIGSTIWMNKQSWSGKKTKRGWEKSATASIHLRLVSNYVTSVQSFAGYQGTNRLRSISWK